MKYQLLSILSVVIFMAACGNNEADTAHNPLFDSEPALKQLTEQIGKHPEKASLYFERGSFLDRMQEDSLALLDYKKAVSLDSNNAEYFSAIGDMLFEHKDLEGSVQWIEKALQLNPKDKKAHLKLAKLFLYIEEYSKAFTEINVVLRQDVYDPEGYYLKGMVYKSMKDTTKSISSFLTALQVQPEYRDAMIQLGIMYSGKGDVIALKYYDNAYKLDTMDVFSVVCAWRVLPG